MNYQLRMYYADVANQTAGSKATRDCSEILAGMGFRHFDVPVYLNKGKINNLYRLLKYFAKLYSVLHAGDQVLLQYPLLGINSWLKLLLRLLKAKDCRLLCLVHDLDSLRQLHHSWTLEQEVERLNAFDLVIVHNVQMKQLLTENGLKAEMRCLDLFDYLVPQTVLACIAAHTSFPNNKKGYNNVAFAGNLGKSVFLKGIGQLTGVNFRLYGPGYEIIPAGQNLSWAGTFDADELPAQLEGDFGLIWDGPALDACNGALGNYLRYNNPHKASLYLLAGLPLIAPKGTAIGAFIEANGIGITLNSLFELPDLLSAMDASNYQGMKASLVDLSRQIGTGAFLKKQVADL